jgi:hypothetical protein
MRCLESQALAVASTQIAFDTLFDTLAFENASADRKLIRH